MKSEVELFLEKQLEQWALAKLNYDLLHAVRVRKVQVGNVDLKIQFNPKRIASSSAKVDKKSIRERACFLCAKNRPDVQMSLPFKTNYEILVNPFPIFPQHFTIPEKSHIPQTIENRVEDMLDLAHLMNDHVIFYNGPQCGASAPDHFHFQAGNKGFLPLEMSFDKFFLGKNDGEIATLLNYPCGAMVLRSSDKHKMVAKFKRINVALKEFDVNQKELINNEPMMNLLCWKLAEEWVLVVIPRALHRPACYFAEGAQNIMISPASVDMGGVFITPREGDFERLNAETLSNIISEVCLDETSLRSLLKHL